MADSQPVTTTDVRNSLPVMMDNQSVYISTPGKRRTSTYTIHSSSS
jgi:hypothetical protein